MRIVCQRQMCLAFLCTLTALTSCQTDSEKADTILYHGKIVTVDSIFSIAEAVALKDGKILATGSDEAVVEWQDNATELIDLEGRTVIPGLIEGHAHPIAASQSEITGSIPVVQTIGELLQWIKTEAQGKEDGEWIIHPKFFITRLADMRQISLAELDEAAPDNPVFLNGSYGGMVNTKALTTSGLLRSNDAGILKDPRSGKPNGLLRRSAFRLLAIPSPVPLSSSQKADALQQLLSLYNSVGFTSVCSGGGTIEELDAFDDLRQNDRLTVRIFHNVRVPLDLTQSREHLAGQLSSFGLKTGDGNEWVKVGALKIVLDGGMLTGTAFLHEPWGENAKDLYGITDPSYRGELMHTKEELIKVISAAAGTGWKFTAHVTGGAGVDTLLAAYEVVNAEIPIKQRRFSIIHGNFFTDSAIHKMSRMGVYADMQPAWFYKDTELLSKILGSERLKTFHPYRSLIEGGVIINAGSDHMVKVDPNLSINPYNPFIAMWSVVTRKTDRGTVFNPEQVMSREDALRMYTINNAMASFEEDLKGSIEPGKYADLVVLSHDLLTCPDDSIRIIRPLLTMVDGEIVFDARGAGQ